MATYTEHQQRELDQAFEANYDRDVAASKLVVIVIRGATGQRYSCSSRAEASRFIERRAYLNELWRVE